MISLAGQRMTITGKLTGLFIVGASVGGMFLPWLVGQLMEPVGSRVMMSIMLIDLVVATALFFSIDILFNSATHQSVEN